MLALLLLVGLTSVSLGGEPGPDAETFFEMKVRPVFHQVCYRCHGGQKVSGHLRIDSREALLKGGESGPAIVPGDPEKSLLLQAVRYRHESIHMPPGKVCTVVLALPHPHAMFVQLSWLYLIHTPYCTI
jgi:hypothetical protein